jgi:hypothetical protein
MDRGRRGELVESKIVSIAQKLAEILEVEAAVEIARGAVSLTPVPFMRQLAASLFLQTSRPPLQSSYCFFSLLTGHGIVAGRSFGSRCQRARRRAESSNLISRDFASMPRTVIAPKSSLCTKWLMVSIHVATVVVDNLRLTPVSTSGCQKVKTDGSPEKQLIGPVCPTSQRPPGAREHRINRSMNRSVRVAQQPPAHRACLDHPQPSKIPNYFSGARYNTAPSFAPPFPG